MYNTLVVGWFTLVAETQQGERIIVLARPWKYGSPIKTVEGLMVSSVDHCQQITETSIKERGYAYDYKSLRLAEKEDLPGWLQGLHFESLGYLEMVQKDMLAAAQKAVEELSEFYYVRKK